MKQLQFALYVLTLALVVWGVAHEMGEYINGRMCVEPSALPWLWCHK